MEIGNEPELGFLLFEFQTKNVDKLCTQDNFMLKCEMTE